MLVKVRRRAHTISIAPAPAADDAEGRVSAAGPYDNQLAREHARPTMAPFAPQSVPNGGLHAAATERKREPIRQVLRRVLPATGVVLE